MVQIAKVMAPHQPQKSPFHHFDGIKPVTNLTLALSLQPPKKGKSGEKNRTGDHTKTR